MRNKFLILFFILLSGEILGQQVFEHINSTQGLASDKVADIIQDKDGFYWIATAEGLNRFDGSTFKIYRHNKNDSSSLSNNSCSSLLEDDNGDIWIGTAQGVNRFIKKKGIFQRFYFHQSGINDNLVNFIMDMTQDANGDIWVAAFGLWKIDHKNNSVKGYLFNEKDLTSISDASQCLRIGYDNNQNGLWIATSSQLNFFNITKQQFYHPRHNPYQWPVFTWENHWPFFVLDKQANTWLYDEYERKLYLFKPGANNYDFVSLSFQHPIAKFLTDNIGNIVFSMEPQHALLYNWASKKMDSLKYSVHETELAANYKINQCYLDRNKNTWLCTQSGLFVSKNPEKRYNVYSVGNTIYDLPKSINGLVVRKGIAWIGIENSLYEYDFNAKRMTKVYEYPSPHGFRPMYNDGDSVLWTITAGLVVLFDFNKRKIISETPTPGGPYFVRKDSSRNFWIGTWANGFYKLNEKAKVLKHYGAREGLKQTNLVSCFSDGEKCIWFGMNAGAGFTRFDLRSEKFENFIINSAKTAPEINTINAISPDKQDNIWLGTYGGGLYYFDRAKNTFINYGMQDGLSGDYINTLIFDAKENLWISTTNGIDIMNTSTRSIYHINESMKFGSNDHIHNVSQAGTDSFFYFAANKILAIQPGMYEATYSSPTILVSSFKVLDKDYPESMAIKTITLPYKKNFFTVGFSVLKVSPMIPANYKYKLEDFDNDWINAGNRGMANYTNVPPGKYKLLLNATDEIGRWSNEPQVIFITITPPFWKTWWFISLVSITVLSGLYFFYRYRIAQVKKLYSLRSKISQDLHDEVASTLSGIKLYSEMAKQQLGQQDAGKVQQSLDVISANASEMKEDMNDIIWAINPANDSFGKLLQKLKVFAANVCNAAGIKFNLEEIGDYAAEKLNMQFRRNIYLICKESINNAVKYSGAAKIEMLVQQTDHTIRIIIRDDGKGFNTLKQSEGNGLLNMKLRSGEIGAEFMINSVKEKGTEVQLLLRM